MIRLILKKKILIKNFFSGLSLNLSSIIPNIKNENRKKKIDIYSLIDASIFINCKLKIISKRKYKTRLHAIKKPPNKGTLYLCFFNILSGLSKILINLEIFFILKINNKFEINTNKKNFVISANIFYMNIGKDQYYNKELLKSNC